MPTSALGVLVTFSLPPSRMSQAQPLPNCVAPAVLNCVLNSSYEPKSFSIADLSSPVGSPTMIDGDVLQGKRGPAQSRICKGSAFVSTSDEVAWGKHLFDTVRSPQPLACEDDILEGMSTWPTGT